MKVNAAQQQQSLLTVTAARAKTTAASKSAESGSTFRSSMERAEQNAAAAAKSGDAEQPQTVEEEVQPEGELNAEVTNQEETATPVEPGAEGVGNAMEGAESGIVEIIMPMPGEQEDQAAEELALSMSQTAALQQQATIVTAPEAQQEIAQQAAGGELAAAIAPKEQGQGAELAKAVEQPVLEQAAPSQEGEAQAKPMNSQITAPGATEGQAGTESAARQAAEGSNQNTAEAPKQEAKGAEQITAQTIFAAQQGGPDAVLDLGAAAIGEPLPEAEAGRMIQQSLLDQVQTAASTGKDEIFIQLKPETLGGLVIHLAMTEEGIKAQVRTGSENVQNLVTAQISQLEDALRARDIPVVQMEVIYDPAAGNGFMNGRGQNWQGGGAQQGRGYGVNAVEDPGSVYEAAVLAAADTVDGLESPGVDYSA